MLKIHIIKKYLKAALTKLLAAVGFFAESYLSEKPF